ncbi:MAG: hypothetical protein AAF420_03470, partial [Pseudomonadota bacterium]
FSIPLTEGDWYRFPYSGNLVYGNNKRDYDAVVGLGFEFGLHGQYYFKQGSGRMEIKGIKVVN